MGEIVRTKAERYPELYLLKGLALLAMIIYHGALVSEYVSSGLFKPMSIWYPLPIATSFLFLSGISISIIDEKPDRDRIYQRILLRLGASSILITIATAIVLPQYTIWFGILHLILLAYVASWILGQPSLWRGWKMTIILLLFILGALQYRYWISKSALDYVPIFPYIGAILAGVLVGNATYSKEKRIHLLRCKPLEYMGRYSLVVYLVHVPILYAIFLILTRT